MVWIDDSSYPVQGPSLIPFLIYDFSRNALWIPSSLPYSINLLK